MARLVPFERSGTHRIGLPEGKLRRRGDIETSDVAWSPRVEDDQLSTRTCMDLDLEHPDTLRVLVPFMKCLS